MAWEWSHTQEAYDNVKANLALKPLSWLSECYAEIVAHDHPMNDCNTEEEEVNKWDRMYAIGLKTCETLPRDMIIDVIWKFASEDHRTCSNGGFQAHMCPSGCHHVSFDPPQLNLVYKVEHVIVRTPILVKSANGASDVEVFDRADETPDDALCVEKDIEWVDVVDCQIERTTNPRIITEEDALHEYYNQEMRFVEG